jgi:hypothetical protein
MVRFSGSPNWLPSRFSPFATSRGQAIARMLLLHPDSLKARMNVVSTEGSQ